MLIFIFYQKIQTGLQDKQDHYKKVLLCPAPLFTPKTNPVYLVHPVKKIVFFALCGKAHSTLN
tara:strand:+ start:1240 stop:1428 length:189 start_codon:yes stop_codon:yes gene_type:complete